MKAFFDAFFGAMGAVLGNWVGRLIIIGLVALAFIVTGALGD